MKRKFVVLSLLIVLVVPSIFATGCWSRREVEDIAIDTLAGFDLINQNGKEKIQTSFLMARPFNQKTDKDTKDQTSTSDLLIKGIGFSLTDSVVNVMKRIPRTPFYGHTHGSIYGKNLAQEKMAEIIEVALRQPDIRPMTPAFVTKGEAFTILQAFPATLSTLALQVFKQAEENALNSGAACKVTHKEFSAWLLSTDRDAVLPEIEAVNPENGETILKSVIIQGFGVFRDAKLVGWLDQEESRGYLLIAKTIKKGQIPISLVDDGKELVYLLVGSKSKIQAKMTGTTPSFKITIQTQGVLYEAPNISFDFENIRRLEQLFGEKIRELPMKTIAKALEYDSDFLGLMQRLHRFSPSAWKQVGANWRESFRDADIEVEVKAKILNAGSAAKSAQ